MASLLNTQRPPVFCPGCAHDRVTHALDKAFERMGLDGQRVAIVSDIGCSGLFDTFFNTHAFHGLHGRALTYATGLKMARPDLTVVVTMGDGGLGIGGAHLLSACRRNNDLALLVLNNFNYGMTGGQFSATTPPEAQVGSGFLNRLEKPIDACQVAAAAGGAFAARSSVYDPDLAAKIEQAIRHPGFAVLDMWGVCPGRFTKRNRLTPAMIEASIAALPKMDGPIAANQRPEYGTHYRDLAARQPAAPPPPRIAPRFTPPDGERREIVILGRAGQRIVTAGELLCLAGLSAGLQATQKNDYPITVLRGHSVSEVVLASEAIDYTGIQQPAIILALAAEGVARRRKLLSALDARTLIVKAAEVDLPATGADVVSIDFKGAHIKPADWALAALAVLAQRRRGLTPEMLAAALDARFKGATLQAARDIVSAGAGLVA